MRKRLMKYVSVLLSISIACMLLPAAVLGMENGDTSSVTLTQVGDVLDFEDGELVGTADAPSASGPGSITVADFDSKLLRVQPPERDGASFRWALPLNEGEYDLTGHDLIEVTFDWWVDITRPWNNSLDVSLNDGSDQVVTLRTSGGGTSVNSPATISYYSGNKGVNNAPEIGEAITALTNVPRLTKLSATLNVDLLEKVASISLTDGGSITYTSTQPLPIPVNQLTSLSIGASRASGATWARFNPVDGVEWDEDSYGMRVDNIVFRAASTDREKPTLYPNEIVISPASADLEYGEGSLADKHSATFHAVVLPINADDRTFTWSISDPSIAEIVENEDNSVTVTGVGEGTAILTAKSNMSDSVTASVPVNVQYVPPIVEYTPDFSHLVADGYTLEFGSNFAGDADVPLWIFAGGTYHSFAREDAPRVNHYFRLDASGSGNRGGKGDLPQAIFGSKVYANFDWKVPAVTTHQNTFNVSFQHGAEVLLSLRTGTYNGARTIGAFTGALPGPTGPNPEYFWSSDRYHEFTYNEVETWYTVGAEFDFESMVATVSLVPRDDDEAAPSVLEIPFAGSQISSVVLTGERAGGNNINIVDNGIDNMYFFTKPLSNDTITDVLPYDFLPERPATADQNTWQSWSKFVYIGDAADEEGLGLPDTIQVKVASGNTETVGVTWELTEVPWSNETADLVYDNSKQGVFTYVGTIEDSLGVAVNRMEVKPMLYIENRHKNPLTSSPISMEWLDRGVVAIPENGGEGILVTWRLLASEYNKGVTFNVFRNGVKINASPVTTLNYIDADGEAGDLYVIETVNTGEMSKPATAWANNFIDIPLQRPADRPNPALAYGGAEAEAQPITYTANDMSVADVNGDGQYEVIVKWYPSQAQDPGLANRHTGETIFDAYTLEGQLLWRINLGINVVSSAHHSPFNFYDLDQDGKAEFVVKTADGTRGYLPKADGTIDDLTDTPAWVLGDPEAVWVGGLQNPALGNQINETALGRVASGPETITVFNGQTGEPIDTVDYFAPYNITPNWGDNNNNRSDRFNGAVAYMPKNGVKGAEPYPTVIEVRGHYGPHFVAAYQLIDGNLIEIWDFRLAEWNAGGNQGNHNLQAADLDFDGYYEIVLGGIALDQDGTVLWSTNGTRGTAAAGHGDALHVAAMVPDSNEIYVFQPHESGPPNNVTLVRGSTGEPVWTYSANAGDVGRGVAANVTPLPGYEVWASNRTPMYNIVSGQVITTEGGDIGVAGKAPVNFILYWDGDLLSELFDGPDNNNSTEPPSITKFMYDVETGQSELITLQNLTGAYSNNGTKANPGLTADIFGDWREEVLVRTSDNNSLRIYTTDLPTEHVISTLMHDPLYRMSANSQNSMYNQPTHLGYYLGEDIRDKVQAMQLPVPNIYYTMDKTPPGEVGGWTPIVTPPAPEVSVGEDGAAEISPRANVDGDRVAATISDDLFKRALESAQADENGSKKVVIRLDQDAKQVQVQLPVQAVRSSENHQVVISSSLGNIILPSNMLSNLDIEDGDTVELVVEEVESQAASDRKVLEIHVMIKGEKSNWSNTEASVTVEVAYEPTDDEESRYEFLSVVHIDDEGNRTPVYNGRYDPDTGKVVFTTSHFSQYAVVFDPKSFSDIGAYAWAKHEIEVLATKGIINGTSVEKNTFSPGANISRADFILLLVKTLGLNAQVTDNFSDVRVGDYYYEAVGIAKALGITNGDGTGNFNPRSEITRQDMFTLTARALAVSGYELGLASADVLAGFTDQDDIADYARMSLAAMVAEGLVLGNNGSINPNGNTTRAEAAVFLYRIYSL